MDNVDPQKLVGGYATGNLTDEQRRELLRSAFNDQALFDELADEEVMRMVLQDATFQQQLRRRLLELKAQRERTAVARTVRWWRSPWVLGFAAAAAATVLAVVLINRNPEGGPDTNLAVALGSGSLPSVSASSLREPPLYQEMTLLEEVRKVPVQKNIPSAIGFDRPGRVPEYKIGDPMRIGFTVDREANVLVIEERPDGSTVRLFPNRFVSSPRVPAGEKILIPPAGQGDMQVEGPAGKRKVRMLVFPPDIDPLANGELNWKELQGKITVLEKRYEVVSAR